MNTLVPAKDPLDILWQAPAILWMMVAGEGLALMLTLALGVDEPFRFFGMVSVVTQWILLLTLAEVYVVRGLLRRLRMQTIAQIALGLLLVNAWAIASVTWMIFQPTWNLDAAHWDALLPRMLGIVLVAGGFGLVAFHMHAKARRLAVAAKQAQLETLQARIQPHFLFNTLNTAVALVRARPAVAEQLLMDLSDLFRAALTAPRDVPLAEELALTRRYLEIESLRLGERMHLEWHVPDALPPILVPSLSLQPLAENAVRHGVEPSPTGGQVDVRLEVSDSAIVVTIANTLPETAHPTQGHRMGLTSARERIAAAAGGGARMEVWPDQAMHRVTVTLPLETHVTTR